MHNSLQSENESLRRQLETLLHEARRNEEKMRRFDLLEQRLIGTRSLTELIRLLLADYKAAFELDIVNLVLIDPEYELARLLEARKGEIGDLPGLQLQQEGFALENLFRGNFMPELETFEAGRHGFLFAAEEPPPASVALLPLACQGRLIGSLNLGSHVAERFSADSGTEFLRRMAAIAAVCLENALNHERLQLLGLTDPLTGVNNRRYFERRLHEEVTRAKRHDMPLTCMFVDIDKFKRINDSHGHQAGDEVLRSVAAIIKAQLRGSDIIARYGGEEFVILLPHTAIRHACDIAERIRARVAARLHQPAAGVNLLVTVSIGVSTLPEGAADAEIESLSAHLVGEADKALYQAKESGRNRVVSELVELPKRQGWPLFVRTALNSMLR